MIYRYFAIFEEDKKEGGFDVIFPDIFGGVTCGDNFADALTMAKDLLKLMLTSAKGQCFEPSKKNELIERFPDKKLVEIEIEI